MGSGVSLASPRRGGTGDLTGLMIFRVEVVDNSFCRVAIAEPAMET